MSNRQILAINALAAALLGALSVQILHEACHGVTAMLVGAEWQAFNLFAVLWDWPGALNETGAVLVEAHPALLNILLGFLGVILFAQTTRQQRAMPVLFWMYFTGYNLFMGSGFLPRLMFGLRRPKHPIPGMELAGEIEAVGPAVTHFQKGDRVWGISVDKLGAYAEYLCLPENNRLVKKPGNVSFEAAASMPEGSTTALYFLRDVAKLQPKHKILFIGTSGGTGVFAFLLAKFYGAEVTGVCSTVNLELVQSMGADQVIDYTRQDFTQNGKYYDVILDMVHGQGNFSRYRASLKPHGKYLAVSGGLKEFAQMAWTSLTGGKKVVAASVPDRQEDLTFLNELLAAGEIKPFIDRRYPLAHIAEAHRFVDTGRKHGSVLITKNSEA